MAKVLPPKVLHRKDKLGFPTPEESWFRPPKPTVQQWVEDTIALYPDLLYITGLRRMVADTLEGRRPFSFQASALCQPRAVGKSIPRQRVTPLPKPGD